MSKRLDLLEHTVSQQGQFPVGSFLNPANNCRHILHQHPLATSGKAIPCSSYMNLKFLYTGYYWLQRSPSNLVKVYCDMERVCGCGEGSGEGGGWMRVADINMTRPNENCPAGFRKVTA